MLVDSVFLTLISGSSFLWPVRFY